MLPALAEFAHCPKYISRMRVSIYEYFSHRANPNSHNALLINFQYSPRSKWKRAEPIYSSTF